MLTLSYQSIESWDWTELEDETNSVQVGPGHPPVRPGLAESAKSVVTDLAESLIGLDGIVGRVGKDRLGKLCG